MLEELAEGYTEIVLEQEGSRKEFFGLRDFYRLELVFLRKILHDIMYNILYIF